MGVVEDVTERAGSTTGTVRLTTAQAIVLFLQQQWSERDGVRQRAVQGVFGILGHGNVYGLGQALEELGDDLPYYQGKNEQAMVHAAIGFAKANDRLATLACTSSIGPGATNMVTGAATATINRIPVLLLPGDTFANRRQGPVLQQLEHPIDADVSVNDCFRPVSRFFDRIARPEQLLTALPQAMRVLLDPAETGAVTIALHQDAEGEAHDFPVAFFAPRTWHVVRQPPSEDQTAAAVDALRSSTAPLIVCGGGVRYSGAETAVVEFANRHGIPAAETPAGRGTTRAADLALGPVGVIGNPPANAVARSTDLVLCIGTRLTDFTTGSRTLFQHPDVRFVGINVSAGDAYKLGAIPVVADARLAVEAMRDALEGTGWRTPSEYQEDVRQRRNRWETELAASLESRTDGPMTEGAAFAVVAEAAQHGDVFTAGSGTPMLFAHRLWDRIDGATPYLEYGFSCMGHELSAALGARLARPEAGEVYAMVGDGTYLMAPSDLATAVQEGAKITVILIENGGYQSIRLSQVAVTGADFGNDLRLRDQSTGRLTGEPLPVDYAANARSFGCAAFEASTPEKLRRALSEARDEQRPTMIVVHVDPESALPPSEVWWDVGVARASAREAVKRAADEHAKHAATQRYYG
jgi:3D-(3,5/4)-trihydroxycyclohexane-1,2-dione acylhydrolase (decyclizing)